MARLRIVARWRGSPSRRTRWIAGSLGIHLLFTWVLVAAPGWRPEPPLRDTSLVVDLVASAPAAPPRAEPAPSHAAPERAPPRPIPAPARVESAATPRKARPTSPPPDPTPPAADEPREEATRSGPAEGAAAEADPALGDSGVVAEGPLSDSALAWYRSSVIAALHANWRRPILEGLGEPFEVRVTFDILRDGRVARPRIDRPSGVPSLDRSALRAVQDASPLPPPPASWNDATLPASFIFRLFPE